MIAAGLLVLGAAAAWREGRARARTGEQALAGFPRPVPADRWLRLRA